MPSDAADLSSSVQPRSRQNIQVSLTLGFLVLGVLLALQVNTQRALREGNPASNRPEWWYQERLREREERMGKIEDQNRELTRKVAQFEASIGRAGEQSEILKKELEGLRALAGFTSVSGPGIVVTVADSPRAAKGGVEQDLFIVHDVDLLQLVNELWNAGAEAIAINGIRLCSGWDIRCAGTIVKVHGQKIPSPYRIEAIGDPSLLQSAVKLPGGITDYLQGMGLKVKARTVSQLVLPAGMSEKPKFSKPVKLPTGTLPVSNGSGK
jgi:uncharacterized protein YlxW (UPF0749 family)